MNGTNVTRTQDGILHFLSREQMAEEIVRLDAALAATQTAKAAPEGVSNRTIEDSQIVAPASPQPLAPPPGYVLAPILLTADMRGLLTAAEGDTITDGPALLEQLWGELLAAAPQPPASVQPLAVGVEAAIKPNPMALRNVVLDLVTAAQSAALSSAPAGVYIHGEEGRLLAAPTARNLSAKALAAETEIRQYVADFYAAPPGGIVPLSEERIEAAAHGIKEGSNA